MPTLEADRRAACFLEVRPPVVFDRDADLVIRARAGQVMTAVRDAVRAGHAQG
ncbi:MAG TPA: hypothetical protein VFL90_03675 [Methylomirabilota bacterium]|nr:hypothetical protein [Methylomirabilota bacterium]